MLGPKPTMKVMMFDSSSVGCLLINIPNEGLQGPCKVCQISMWSPVPLAACQLTDKTQGREQRSNCKKPCQVRLVGHCCRRQHKCSEAIDHQHALLPCAGVVMITAAAETP
jgi:hypothetical protein